jgi:hypothetical protein
MNAALRCGPDAAATFPSSLGDFSVSLWRVFEVLFPEGF